MVTRGRFVAFEGGEACGKSTQAALLATRLSVSDEVELTHEPGATAVGASIRSLLLSPDTADLDPRAEALLMAADRAQHVTTMIEPALAAGRHVICDRYIASSLAYQGFGRGLDVAQVREISAWASRGIWPDLNVLLDVPASVVVDRLDRDLDRFEAAGAGFHQRVADGFRSLAEADPDRWVVIDGAASVDEVARAVSTAVSERLGIVT